DHNKLSFPSTRNPLARLHIPHLSKSCPRNPLSSGLVTSQVVQYPSTRTKTPSTLLTSSTTPSPSEARHPPLVHRPSSPRSSADLPPEALAGQESSLLARTARASAWELARGWGSWEVGTITGTISVSGGRVDD
ncbi:hypothetical protein FRB90_003388, partial [Tulasnella sp. 427]